MMTNVRRVWLLVPWVLTACGRTDLAHDASAADGGCVGLSRAEEDAEVMRRWNAAVASGTEPIDFRWRRVDDFPHPTFSGGSSEAYAQFADVLLRFWASAGTVDFMACHALFERPYLSGPAAGARREVQLRPLTRALSVDSYLDSTHREALAEACARLGC